jgi:Subtilase family
VGGLSYGSGKSRSTAYERDVSLLIADEIGFPSPFTCTGFGVDGAIKPDLVDYAGDWRFERGRIVSTEPQHAGVPTIAKNFAPPNGRLFRTVAGTSFAAPRVANLAARLFNEFPAASSNLIRAIIADSARIPKTRPALFEGKDGWADEILQVYGYGQPDFERARWSDESEVLLLTDGVIGVDSFQIFTIPSLPPKFLSAKGNGFISVTLAFDPPTRHTRGDSYLGITMSYDLYRNKKPEDIADLIRVWSKEEKESKGIKNPPSKQSLKGRNRISLNPNKTLLAKGTLQKGTTRISGSSLWEYDSGPLYLAVICQRKWVPASIDHQRFAVVVSIAHENPEVKLYTYLKQHAQITNRARVRV